MGGQILHSGQQHGRVAIVTAGVHLARMAAGVRKGVELLHGQGVHIGTQTHGLAALTAITAMNDADHAGLAQTAMRGNAPIGQLGRYQIGGANLFKAQLRVGMDIAPQCGNVRGAFFEFRQQEHALSPWGHHWQ